MTLDASSCDPHFLDVLDPCLRIDGPEVARASAACWRAESAVGPVVLAYDDVVALSRDRRLGPRQPLQISPPNQRLSTLGGAQIICLSLGFQTVDDTPPIGLETAVEMIAAQWPDVLLVVAAGNFGDSRPCWPAALKGVTAIRPRSGHATRRVEQPRQMGGLFHHRRGGPLHVRAGHRAR